jgi:hypothetical protein
LTTAQIATLESTVASLTPVLTQANSYTDAALANYGSQVDQKFADVSTALTDAVYGTNSAYSSAHYLLSRNAISFNQGVVNSGDLTIIVPHSLTFVNPPRATVSIQGPANTALPPYSVSIDAITTTDTTVRIHNADGPFNQAAIPADYSVHVLAFGE